MKRASTRIRIGVHVRSDVGAVAQLIAPVLGMRASRLAGELRQGTVLAGPFPRVDAEEIAEALSSFGVAARVEAEGNPLTTTQNGMPRITQSQLMQHRAHRSSSAQAVARAAVDAVSSRRVLGRRETMELLSRSVG